MIGDQVYTELLLECAYDSDSIKRTARKRRFATKSCWEASARTERGSLRVTAADKVHNAESILDSHALIGPEVWNRFRTNSREDQIAIYRDLVQAIAARNDEFPAQEHTGLETPLMEAGCTCRTKPVASLQIGSSDGQDRVVGTQRSLRACSSNKFRCATAGEVYDVPEIEPNRKSRLRQFSLGIQEAIVIQQLDFLRIDVHRNPFWLGAAIKEAPKFRALGRFRNPLQSKMRHILLLLLLFLFSPATYAQSIVTFTITGTLVANGFSFSYAPGSTITIDTSTGLVTASNITIEQNGDQFTLNNLTISNPNEIFWANSPAFGSLLIEPLSSFKGFTGGAVKLAEYIPDLGTVFDSSDTKLTGCALGLPDTVLPFPGGPSSKDGKPTSMTATFAFTNGLPSSLSEQDAAAACGYTGFDWQQLIERWPLPSNLTANSAGVLTAPPSFFDPPPGGYTYFTSPKYLVFAGAWPFYYNPAAVPSPPITIGGTLNFFDQPKDPLLPAGDHLAFRTRLVGLTPLNAFGGDILYEFTWQSTYSGATGGVSETASISPDDGSGTGGVTLTSINGVPIAIFSAFSNKLEATATSFQLVLNFTLASSSDGINPVTEPTTLRVGSYIVAIPAGSFHMISKGRYVYEGTINGESLQLQIVPDTSNTYTLKVEGSGTTFFNLGNPTLIVLKIGNDIGAGTATLN
jgi:hypothetical protein